MTDASALRANVRRFYLYRFLVNLQLWLPIWVLYLQRQRGLTLGQVAALDAPFWLVNVLAQIPTGAFADRFGRKRSLLVGCIVLAAAYLAFGLASSFPVLLLSYLLWAVGLSFQSGADLALLYDNLAQLNRTDDYGRIAGRAFGLTAAGGIVGIVVGAWLADVTSLDVPILVSAVLTLGTVLLVFTFHEPRRERGARAPFLRTMHGALATAWRLPSLRYLLGLSAAVQAASFAPILFVQPFLSHYGTPVSLYGVLQTPARIVSIVAAVFAYRLTRLLDERRLLVALPVWICVCLLVLVAWHQPAAFVVFPLVAFAFGAANPLFSDVLNRLIPAAERATVLSVGQLLAGLLAMVLEPSMGAAAQARGISAGFLVATGVLAMVAVAMLVPWLRLAGPVVEEAQPIAIEAESG